MSLYHHDNRDYATAATDAARFARGKMEALIAKGTGKAGHVIQQVLSQVPRDRIAAGKVIEFEPGPDGVYVAAGDTEATLLHPHALGQVASRGDIPQAYVNHLMASGDWGKILAAHNFQEVYRHNGASDKRYLLRDVQTAERFETRGFLSDRFRRLDSRPIVESFAEAVQALGAVPVEGHALDTKIALKAMLPKVYEPVANEVMAFGLVLENSDFGDGALTLRSFALRLWCTNYGITEDAMRKVHLGGRLSDDLTFSERTYQLDTDATASAIGDVVRGLLAPAHIEGQCAAIKTANEEEVTPGAVKAFLKRHLNKGEAAAAAEAFTGADIVNLPPGQNKWRLSNAISWVAGQTEDKGRALELMKVAGKAFTE